MNDPNKNDPLLSKQSPWNNNSNNIWLGSTVTLYRNLEKFNFPGKLSSDKHKQIISLLSKELLTNDQLKGPKLINAEDMPPNSKEFLVEHFLTSQSFQHAQGGEAFVLDESGEFLALINIGDHLTLHWVDSSEELEATWDRIVKIETHLNKNINFAFSPKFGFLTSDSSQCGTGLVAKVFLHLPALIASQSLDETIKKYKDEGIEYTGLQGNPNEFIGDIVAFQNAYTLGVTEESILTSLRSLITKVLTEEKSARTHLKNDSNSAMKDKVSRAYAVLLHSYQIEAIEALNAISLLKLGLELEWVGGINNISLNKLFLNSRRAHLLCQYGSKISHEELPHKRAEFIHQALKGTELRIENEE